MSDDYVPYVPIPYTPLPYVSSREYSNRPYTQSLMELVGRAGQREAEATRRRSELLASRTEALGQSASSTLGSLFAGRDEAAKVAEERRRYNLQEARLTAQQKQQDLDREEARAYRQFQGIDIGPNEPMTPEQVALYERFAPGMTRKLMRDVNRFVSLPPPPTPTTEQMLSQNMQQGLNKEPRTPEVPMFGGGIGMESVTEQYGVGRQPTSQEVQQALVMAASEQARKNEIAARVEAATLAREATAEAAARRADDRRLELNNQAALRREIAQMSIGATGDFRSQTQFNTIVSQYTRDPIVAAAYRTDVLRETANSILSPTLPPNPPRQLRLAYAYIGAIDNYMSTVRESELENLGLLDTRANEYRVMLKRIEKEGGFLSQTNADNIAKDAIELANILQKSQQKKARQYSARARVTNETVGDMFESYLDSISSDKLGKVLNWK